MNAVIYGDRYRVEEKIGSGGMAEVYRAMDTTLGRTVAVKLLHAQYAADEDFVARFKREAQAAANLNQPNIVSVYDWGGENGAYYLVMEYLVGRNLKEIIADRGALPFDLAIDIGRQVAAALQSAHRQGIVHRDIKPHNIVITDEGEVKVTDFGIARSTGSNVTQTSAILGTAQYISPEQARGDEVGTQSDLYSLGVVLYEMLTGEVPFNGESPIAVALKHIQEEPRRPSDINKHIPPNLETVVRKAMAKDPANRYISAGEVREDLGRCAEGLPLQPSFAPDNDRTTVIPKPVLPGQDEAGPRRRRAGVTAFVFFLLLLFIGSAAATNFFLGRVSMVQIPKVVGKNSGDAQKLLAKKGLRLRVTEQIFDEKIAAGVIIDQEPGPGKKVPAAGVVNVRVSKGQERIPVPDLANKMLNQVTFSVGRLGLSVGNIRYEHSDTISEDFIILQEPPPGQKVTKGTYINVVVSKGPRPLKTPNVIGKTTAAALSMLSGEGLIATKQEEYDDDKDAGMVINQSPAGGVPIQRGEAVTIIISKGPELSAVPAVTALDEQAAKGQLEGAGFAVQVKDGISEPGSYGKVVSQSPAADSQVRRGSTVTIWVGRKPADSSTTVD